MCQDDNVPYLRYDTPLSIVHQSSEQKNKGKKLIPRLLICLWTRPLFLDYKFAPATDLAPQETKAWRMQLIQDEITSNNPFWSARWMAVFGVAPKLDESLLKVPWIKCER